MKDQSFVLNRAEGKNFDSSSKYPDPKIVEKSGLKSIIMSLGEIVVG